MSREYYVLECSLPGRSLKALSAQWMQLETCENVTQQKLRFCFVTEVDLKQIRGAVTTDFRMVHCLRQLGEVDVIYLEKSDSNQWQRLCFLLRFQP